MKIVLTSFLVSVAVFIAGIFTYHFISQDKIAYVKTGVILQKYQGMIDANKQFASELEVARGNVDTLRKRYEHLKQQEKSIVSSGRAEWGYQIGIAEKEYMDYRAPLKTRFFKTRRMNFL